MIILTSNPEKIKEIKSIDPMLHIEAGPDLKEVQADKDTVIIHKALDAGIGFAVEDTILEIDGEEVVDIRFKMDFLKEGMKAKWVVSFGYNNGTSIRVYRGEVDGIITIPEIFPEDAFAFDPYFIPNETNKTLYELLQEGKKHEYSPRAIAVKKLVEDDILFEKDISEITLWEGDYQND